MPAAFLIEEYGPFGPGQVQLRWLDEPRPADAVLDDLVHRTWNRQVELRRRRGAMIFNGRLARYLRHRVVEGVLAIDVGPTDYANFLTTNLLNWPRGDELGWDLFSNPIGTSCMPLTADGWLLFGRRNDRVAYHAGHTHTFGCGLEAGDHDGGHGIDAFASILRELREELHVAEWELQEMLCLGLIRDPSIRQPELVFDVPLSLTREEVTRRFQPHDPHQEHVALLACRDAPEAIAAFIEAIQPITAVAVGALCLHGRRAFGEPWYRQILSDSALGIG